jgi:hypothetical protein
MIVNFDIKEIGTFTAYHRGYYFKNDALIFPYINVHVDEEFPLNPYQNMVHLNFCYFIIKNAEILHENEVIYKRYEAIYDFSLLTLAGLNLDTNEDSYYVFRYDKGYLDIPDDYEFTASTDEYFLPIDQKLLGKANLDPSRVKEFFNTVPNLI